jgi:hypothetical protein
VNERLVEDLRMLSDLGVEALERLVAAMAHLLSQPLKPADRTKLSAPRDYLTRRVAGWREMVADEPAIVARLENLSEQLGVIQALTGCSGP